MPSLQPTLASVADQLNFSFFSIEEGFPLYIPQFQQMTVFEGIHIDDALLLEGNLILEL